MSTATASISKNDTLVLRDLARELADEAEKPVQSQRRELWKKHNSLQDCRPMMLIFPEGSWEELLPAEKLQCESESARNIEYQLRSRLYYRDHLHDDTVIEKTWKVPKVINNSGWGIESKHIASTEARGAWHFDPVIHERTDLEKICHPEITLDEEASAANLAFTQELFGDILDVIQIGVQRIDYHLMMQYTGWRGLEETMMDMYTEPEMLHQAMSILEEGHRKVLQQYINLNLLTVNNDNSYNNSGGNSYTYDLPQPDYDPEHVRPCDMWAMAESQEMAQVGPDQHAEFVLEYEKRLLEPFGLTGYGCCEPLHDRMDHVLTIPHIRRISISPWSDVKISAEKLGGNYIFSWKPQPSQMVGKFNDELIRNYIRNTIDICTANGCRLEMVLKDTHTCENHPERFDRWIAIAREEIDRVGK